jgi:CheY-like chemotaxis protein
MLHVKSNWSDQKRITMANILVIDDEPDVRDSIAKVLGREGYDVVAANDANHGLELLEQMHFDILITDVIMPGMDGVQAIRHIREIRPQIKVLAISGGGNFGDKGYQPEAITTTAYLKAALTAGADQVLTKPFDRVVLVDAVQSLAQRI